MFKSLACLITKNLVQKTELIFFMERSVREEYTFAVSFSKKGLLVHCLSNRYGTLQRSASSSTEDLNTWEKIVIDKLNVSS